MIVWTVVLGGLALAGPSDSVGVRPVESVAWAQLNPARGDASPRAADLWGSRTEDVPTGFLVRFVDGFSSPPHIHNVSYRAIVLSGEVHNAHPSAEPMWMAPGSFWTQPHGQSHITSARGETMAYVEVDSGPYLVRPVDQAVDSTEKPINVDVSNLVWLSTPTPDTRVAYLWGAPEEGPGGVFLRTTPAKALAADGRGGSLRAVVVAGTMQAAGHPALGPGSLVSGPSVDLTCAGDQPCVVYVRGDQGVRPR